MTFQTSITFTYRNGSEFTEHYAKPLTLVQVFDKNHEAAKRVSEESNIVSYELHTKLLDDRF